LEQTSEQAGGILLARWFAEPVSSTLKMKAICSSEKLVETQGLHGIISQKIILFITTAVKTSNLK
jgi:hypothetical protein